MDEDHEYDRHREEVKMRDLSQFAERHRLSKRRVGSSIVIGDALWRKSGHTVRPEKGEQKSDQHQKQELSVEHPKVSVGIAEFEALVEIFHVGTLGPLVSIAKYSRKEAFVRLAGGNGITAEPGRLQIEFVD